MPTKNTKIITLRVPDRVDFGDVNLHKFVTGLYDMVNIGAVEIINNELVMPERDCESCDIKKAYEEMKDIAHDKNLSVRDFLRMARRG